MNKIYEIIAIEVKCGRRKIIMIGVNCEGRANESVN